MTPATLTAPTETEATEAEVNPLDEKERISEQRLRELQGQRSSLALDAIGGDPKVRSKLLQVEAELSEVEADISRLGLAKVESERRQLAAEKQAQNEIQLAALDKASKLQAEREAEAKLVDAALKAFVRSAARFSEIAAEQATQLQAGGRKQAAQSARVSIGYRIEGALAHWMLTETGGHPQQFLERAPLVHGAHRKPLAEAEKEARPIEPAAKES